jgi:hypothetical protein
MPILGQEISMKKRDIDPRPGRRGRIRLTRLLALAVVGPLMAGSLAYAAGVEPVRRRVDEFLKGTAGLFTEAESSMEDFHLSPNPAGQGVLVMPVDDRGPRAAPRPDLQQSGNQKERSSSSGDSKEDAHANQRDDEKHTTSSAVEDAKEAGEKPQGSTHISPASASGLDQDSEKDDDAAPDGDRDEDESEEGESEGHGSSQGSGESDDDHSGSGSDSDKDDDRSGSNSGHSDFGSGKG